MVVRIVAHTATIQQRHTVPYRFILAESYNDFVVWTENLTEKGEHESYHGGHYFPKHINDPFKRAYAAFSRKAQEMETNIADGNYEKII